MARRKEKEQPQTSREGKTRIVSLLRLLREQSGLTREELVSRLNNEVSVSSIVRWENTPLEPIMTRKQWELFCGAIGVDFRDLPENLAELKEIEITVSV